MEYDIYYDDDIYQLDKQKGNKIMFGYDFSNFKDGKAFIRPKYKNKEGNYTYGPRICINTKGEKLFELPDKDMTCYDFENEDAAFVTNPNGLIAIINDKGEFLTDFVYEAIYGGSEDKLYECERNSKHGHIDINSGKEIIPCMYDEGNYFSEGLASECLNGKWGMIDYNNNIVIPFEYEGTCVCKNNLINAQKNGKWGLINKNNEVVVDFIYDEIDCWDITESLVYPACYNGKWGLIDRYNNIIEDFIYDDEQVISDRKNNKGDFIIFLKGDYKAIYSTKKKAFITDFIYNFIGYLSENRFLVYANHKTGFIDTEGNMITPLIYDEYCHEDFKDGICIVSKDEKDGAINLTGDLVIPCQYYKLHSSNEGLIFAIDSNNKQGYIDKTGNIVIPFGKYNSCQDFHCGLAAVWNKEQGSVYINKQGEILDIKV